MYVFVVLDIFLKFKSGDWDGMGKEREGGGAKKGEVLIRAVIAFIVFISSFVELNLLQLSALRIILSR